MKVVVASSGRGDCEDALLRVARLLAADEGRVTTLRDIGVGNLSRPLSAAEVALLRAALVDVRHESDAGVAVVGYVCTGLVPARSYLRESESGTDEPGRVEVVAVEDHANLTWRSPLTGPNDDSAGPRFPSMTGIYLPEVATGRLSADEGMIVRSGVVAGVSDPSRLNAFEAEAVESHGYAAVSAELVPVVIVAAHMGLRIAAAMVVGGNGSRRP